MSRKLITNAPPPFVKPDPKKRAGFITETRSYKLITPLYGGGVEPNEADPVTVVRASEVRGHLRFWWRATRGGAFDGNLDKMRRAEEKIWGSAAGKYPDKTDKPGPSKVTVIVKGRKGIKDSPFEVIPSKSGNPQVKARRDSKAPPYAAFPLQPEQKKAKIGMQTDSVMVGPTFILEITYHEDDAQDIQAALWAWETFGGIGARTRRGFGALKRTDKDALPAPEPQDVKMRLFDGLKEHVVIDGNWPTGVPHLSRKLTMKIYGQSIDPNDIWRDLIKKLKDFRQKRRSGTPPKPGRSFWPEPESIRKITGDRFPKHKPLPNPVDKFPRAQFGLPIIFKFFYQQEKGYKGSKVGDPRQTKLEGKDHDRLASPLILRPLVCKNGKKDCAVGLAVILEGPRTPPGGLILKGAPSDPKVESKIEPHEIQHISPLKDVNEADVLKAFLEFLK